MFQLSGLGSKLLLGVDPNPENFVCAGIIHTKALQIGTLIRLEPNRQAKVWFLMLRFYLNSYEILELFFKTWYNPFVSVLFMLSDVSLDDQE